MSSNLMNQHNIRILFTSFALPSYFKSSANSIVAFFSPSGKSLINNTNNKGPNTDP